MSCAFALQLELHSSASYLQGSQGLAEPVHCILSCAERTCGRSVADCWLLPTTHILLACLLTQLAYCLAGKDSRSRFTYKDLDGLPEPVQRYFKYALEDRQPCMRYVVLNHTGWCRPRTNLGLRPDEGWKKVRAQQYISAVEPGTHSSNPCHCPSHALC